MKIFNYENNEKVVYVQYLDLTRVVTYGSTIPDSVYNKVSSFQEILKNNNKYKFLRFTSEEAVNFFRDIDWIVDYKKIRAMSADEILREINKTSSLIEDIEERFFELPENRMVENQHLALTFERLNIKLQSLKDIFLIKQGKKNIQMPFVADSDGLLIFSEDLMYKMQTTFNPERMIISKTNGNRFRNNEIVPQAFYKEALSILIKENQDTNEFFNNFGKSDVLSEDGYFQITSLSIIVPSENITLKRNPSTKRTKVNVASLVKSVVKK